MQNINQAIAQLNNGECSGELATSIATSPEENKNYLRQFTEHVANNLRAAKAIELPKNGGQLPDNLAMPVIALTSPIVFSYESEFFDGAKVLAICTECTDQFAKYNDAAYIVNFVYFVNDKWNLFPCSVRVSKNNSIENLKFKLTVALSFDAYADKARANRNELQNEIRFVLHALHNIK